MKIGIHAGSDQGTVDNCKRIGVDEVCLTVPHGDQGYVELDALKNAKDFLADAGIAASSGLLGSFPSQEVMTGQADAEPELENLKRTMDSLGEVGFYSVLNFVASPKPMTEKEENEYWARLLDYYAKFVAMAENAKVKIATHAFYYPDRLVQGSDHLMHILDAIPSDYNGVTLCGGLHIPGDDVSKSVEMFKGKIFFAHARDLGGSRFKTEPETIEVPLGEGEVDVPAMIDALKKVVYEGVICPEHLGPPKVEGEDQLGEAVKYLKRLI
ncbi:sugar phosphate isomerase/epimerase [bacterium]|nr:sugar phosphate isomerase/epimerase [bacterium]